MRPLWLIENYEHDSSLDPFFNAIKNHGDRMDVFEAKPFYDKKQFGKYDNNDCIIFYGTLNLGRMLQKDKGWVPGVYCNFTNLCCHSYYSYWYKYLLNKDYIMLPMMQILERKDEVFNQFSVNGEIFIRPDSGAKPITGQTILVDNIEREFKLFLDYAGNDLDQIIAIISSPKKIDFEYRCVVANKKVVSCCQYKRDRELDIKKDSPSDIMMIANMVAQEIWQPDLVYTLDMCYANGSAFLLEANSFSCAGLYESDFNAVVKEVSEIAIKEWQEYR